MSLDEDTKPPVELSNVTPPEKLKIKEEPIFEEEVSSQSIANPCDTQVKEEDITEPDVRCSDPCINIYENILKEEETKHEDENEIICTKEMTLSDCEACTVCSKIIPSSAILAHHANEHGKGTGYPCRQRHGKCDKKFLTVGERDAHERIYSFKLQRSFACHLCSGTFLTEDLLQTHLLYYHENYEDVLQCPRCPYRFRTVSKYQAHLNQQHLNPPHKCPHCDFATGKKNEMARHRRMNTPCRPFVCPKCELRYTFLHGLSVHWGRVHKYRRMSRRIYVCPLGCNRSFMTVEQLYDHAEEAHQFHLPPVEYPCISCEFKSSTTEGLLIHYRKTRHSKTFHCSVCTLKFIDRVKFAQHFRECAEARRVQAASSDGLFNFPPDSILIKEEVMDYGYENDGEIDESEQDPNSVGWMNHDENEEQQMVIVNSNVSNLVEIKTESNEDI